MWVQLLKDHKDRKVGDVYDLNDEIAETLISLDIAKSTDEPNAALTATLDRAFQGFADAIGKRLEDVTKVVAKAPRIDAGEQEADRTRSFNDFVTQVGLLQKYHQADAFERIAKVYKAPFTDSDGNVLKVDGGQELQVGAYGGVLAPPEYATELLKLDAETAAFADSVRTVPMSGTTKFYPVLRQTGKNAPTGGSNAHGGVVTYRKGEKDARTLTRAEFDFIELKATDLTAYTASTRDLLADAPGAESDFMSLVRGALGWRMDYDFLFGTGSGEPLGIYNSNSTATISVFRVQANTLAFLDFVNLMSKILPQYWGGIVWIMNPTSFPEVVTLEDANGNNVFIPSNAGATSTPAGTILGRPIRWTEKAPALGSAGDVMAAVPSLYLHGLRSGVEIAVSDQFLFDTDQIAYRAKLRNDGQPWLKAPYRMADGSNTQVSAFAKLAATTS